jgi:uncharacterized protein (DUF3084 family)
MESQAALIARQLEECTQNFISISKLLADLTISHQKGTGNVNTFSGASQSTIDQIQSLVNTRNVLLSAMLSIHDLRLHQQLVEFGNSQLDIVIGI